MNIARQIITGTQEVFSTMLMVDVEGKEVSSTKRTAVESNLTSMIGLGGGVRGVLAVHCPADTAKQITGSFLGLEVDELDDDVKDAIGEIANMVAGSVKEAFGQAGVQVELATPTSVIGDRFRLSGIPGASSSRVSFQYNSGRFWIELLYVLS